MEEIGSFEDYASVAQTIWVRQPHATTGIRFVVMLLLFPRIPLNAKPAAKGRRFDASSFVS
jgi:hypothetical protein